MKPSFTRISQRLLAQRRFLLLSALVAAVSFGLGTVLSQTLPKIKSWILVTIDDVSNKHLPVRILPASVDVRFFPLGITLHELRILPTDEFSKTISAFSVKEVSADLALLQIVRGNVVLGDVKVKGTTINVTVPPLPESKGKPLDGLFALLDRLPVDNVALEDIDAIIHVPDKHLNFEISKLTLNADRSRRRLRGNVSVESVLFEEVNQASPNQRSIRFSPEVSLELRPDRVVVETFEVRRGTSMVGLSGTLEGDTEGLDFQVGELALESDIDVKSIRDWLQKSFETAKPTPPMSGRLRMTANIVKADKPTPWKAEFKLDTDQYRVQGILVDKIALTGNWDGKHVFIPSGTADSRAAHFEVADVRIGEGAEPTAEGRTPWLMRIGRIKGKTELHEFMADMGIGPIPVWLTAEGEFPCESQIVPHFQLRCAGRFRGENAVVQSELKTGRVAKGAIAAIPLFEAEGEMDFDLERFAYKAEIKMPDSKGRSQGQVAYKTGFDIKYEADRLAIADLASLGALKLTGALKLKGSTTGDSHGAVFAMDADGQNLWLEDFWLGQPKAQVSYKTGTISFANLQGYYTTSRYNGDVSVDLTKGTIATTMRVPFFDSRDLLRVFSKKFTFPFPLSGTGQASIKASGPLGLAHLTYDLKSSLFKGQIAGESYDQIHFDVKSDAGEVKSERVSFSKGEAVVQLTGVGHPDGTIKADVKGRGLKLEETNKVSESGFALAGLVNFDMTLKGPVLAPDADMNGSVTRTSIADVAMPDSSFNLKFMSKTIEGSGTLLGDTVQGKFIWPLAPDAPLSLQFESKAWNFAPLFSAIAGPQGRRDFEGRMTAKVDLKASHGGLWAANGGATVSELSLRRGTIQLANERPVQIDVKDGAFSIRDFSLVGEGTFLKVTDREGPDAPARKFDAQINAKLDMNLLSIFTPFFEELRGLLSIAMSVKIGPEGSDVIGTAYADRTFIKFPDFPHAFENIQADMLFNHQKIVLNTIKSDFAGGKISASGSVDLKGKKNYPTNVVGSFEKITLNVPDKMRTSGSGDFSFTGDWFPFLLKGTYNIRDGLITKEFGEDGDGDANLRRDQFLPRFLVEESFVPMMVDMKLDLGSGVQVKNNYVEGSVAGKLQISGNPKRPAIDGQIHTLTDARIKFRENIFDVTSAVITFDDPQEINPKMNVNARTRVDDYDVTLLVQGRAKKPEPSLSSVPPMAEKDLISLLALGVTDKTLAEKVGSQQQSNAGGQQVLTSVANPLVNQVTKRLGFETQLSPGFDQTGEAYSRVTVKKQFTKKLEASASQSVGKKQNEKAAKVRYRLTDRVSAVGSWEGIDQGETSASSTTQTQRNPDKFGFDFEYKFEFK